MNWTCTITFLVLAFLIVGIPVIGMAASLVRFVTGVRHRPEPPRIDPVRDSNGWAETSNYYNPSK